MAAPVPVTSSAPSTNGPSGPAPSAAAPPRSVQRDGGNTSLGTFGVRIKSFLSLIQLHVPQVKSGLAQMLKVRFDTHRHRPPFRFHHFACT